MNIFIYYIQILLVRQYLQNMMTVHNPEVIPVCSKFNTFGVGTKVINSSKV